MKQTLTEVVAAALRRIQELPEKPLSERTLRAWLVRQGYAKGDIDAAMKLVGPRFRASRAAADRQPGPVRSLSLHEEYKLHRRHVMR